MGQGVFTLGEPDKNELKEKPNTTNWKKYISFAFGGNKQKQQENKGESEKKPLNIDKKEIVKLTPDAIQKNYILADCCKPIREMMYWDTLTTITVLSYINANALLPLN